MLDRCNKYGDVGLWMRAAYIEGFKSQSIRAVVRAGDRLSKPDFKTLEIGVDYPVRFIQTPGVGFEKPAVLYPDDGTTVAVVSRFIKRIGTLDLTDLDGMAPDAATPQLVRYHLAMVNNTPLPADDEWATIYRFIYQPTATE